MSNFNWPINPTTLTPGPIQFELDGVDTEVSEDTGTPADSRPLPTKVLDGAGAEVDFATEAKQDSQILELQQIEADVEATKTAVDTVNTSLTGFAAKSAAALVPEAHDYIALTYVAAGNGEGEIETVTYKSGGAAGTTEAVLTLAYDASNKLTSVTRS
jgi:hypothetical protein